MYDALIVGAGPAGATGARLLARAGWSVALVEKSVFPRRKVCGEFISGPSLRLLDQMGVGEAFAARAGPEIRRVGLFSGNACVTASLPSAGSRSPPWGRALGRESLDTLLRDAAVAAGAKLMQPVKLTRLERSGTSHVAQLEGSNDAETLAARIVIAASGSWERGPLSPRPRTHLAVDLLAFKAHFHESGLPADLMPLLMFPGGYGGMATVDGGRAGLSCCIRRDVLRDVRRAHPSASAGEAVLAYIERHCMGVRDALARAKLAGVVLSAGPIRPGFRPVHREGVFRIGNAAGEAHPVIAEGISMAIQSAWLLCSRLIAAQDALAAGEDTREIGAAYGRDWVKRFGPRVAAAAVLAEAAMRPPAAALAARAVKSAPSLLTWGASLSGKDSPPPRDGSPASAP